MPRVNSTQLDFIYRWSRYITHIDITVLLRNNSFTNIAIYGGGVLGELFYEYLYETDVTIRCIIDRNTNLDFPYDVEILTPEQFIESNMTLDAVFITPLDFSGIISYLKPFVDYPLIPLDHFVIDVDVLQYLSDIEKKLENSGSFLYLLDFTLPLVFIKNPSYQEQINFLHKASHTNYDNGKNVNMLRCYYDDLPEYCDEYIENTFSLTNLKCINKNGIIQLQDVESKYHNVLNGKRSTSDNPKVYDTTIRFFGNCNAVGCFVEDKYTIQSQLQRKLNGSQINRKMFRVLNHSNWQGYPESLKQICDTEFTKSDIIILLSIYMEYGLKYYINSKYISYTNIVSAFDRPHDMGEVFLDTYHMNHRGYKLFADKIFSILSTTFGSTEHNIENNIISKRFPAKKNKTDSDKKSLDIYVSFLQNEKVDCSGIIGSIVMNCNPFTLGHRYLIKQAKSQCDYLYIFVVEEDKSFFSFQDRFELVKAGISDIPNIKVIRGGGFIISALTLPEYFTKDTNPHIKIDASKDVNIFSKNIAPVLNIKKRFVGEEPLDPITNQYNQALLEVLPKNGIDLIVIPRKTSPDGNPISASRVRKLLKIHDYEKISVIVPKTTLDYLKKVYRT